MSDSITNDGDGIGGERRAHPRLSPTKTPILALVAVKVIIGSLISGLLFLAAFATCNDWQWRCYKRASTIVVDGSRTNADVTLYQSERLLQWDTLGYAGHDAIDVGAIEGRLWRSSPGVVLPKAVASVPTLLASFVMGGALIAAAAAGTAGRILWARRRWSSDATTVTRASESRDLARVSLRNGVYVGVLWAIPIGVAVWYVTYDRSQASRFVGESFSPRFVDTAIGICAIGLVGFLSLTRNKTRNLADGSAFAPAQRCSECGYSLQGLGGSRCPECGHEQSHHPVTDSRRRRVRWIAATCLVAATCVAAMVAWSPSWALKRVYRSPLMNYSPGAVWNWLSVRGEPALWYRVALLRLDDAWRLECDGLVTWVHARRLVPDPVEASGTLQTMPTELVWASFDRRTNDLVSSGALRQRGWESPAPLSNAWVHIGGTQWYTNWQANHRGLIHVKMQGDLHHFSAMSYSDVPTFVPEKWSEAIQREQHDE